MIIPDFEIELKLLQQRSEARVAITFAALQLQQEVAFTLWRWRTNEQEAVVLAFYLEQFTQYLMPRFGSRRNGSAND